MDMDGTLLLNLKRLVLLLPLSNLFNLFLLELQKETKPIEAFPECVKLGK